MESGIQKCAVLVIKKRKTVKTKNGVEPAIISLRD